MGLEDLSQIASGLEQKPNPLLIAGFESNEDCGAMLLSNQSENVMLSSVDFITPVVNDPYIYGQIAAANALSDIFAMGGSAISALNLLMWDNAHFDTNIANAILRGGLDKITEAGALLLGGHTIKDKEQKYGLSVNGMVHKSHIWRNHTGQIGDVLVLTKPIGSGILTTAIKADMLKESTEVIQSMQTLNLYAANIAKAYEIHACTDITGFGLIGHGLEMCEGLKHTPPKSILFYTQQIPLFHHVQTLAQNGIIPGGSYENKKSLQDKVALQCTLEDDIFYYDAQTSGGLLFALPSKQVKDFINSLHQAGIEQASIIGEIVPKAQRAIILG
ncbi:selenide, water dikinase SelD [Helicobacter marmotae]|uniref:Selenide, water dikinase SelD n=1 Tax=Helicobacter marmotae TaxID=152490 RepID=A0A3D8I453_9HELI|nr:selenide, water dikinase SelD [Helicobacter marmotae]RDU59932.1 selenide, water dikinase SelD [Helicobacter marmotae]